MRLKQAIGPCVEWDAARSKNGYGLTKIDGTTAYVHRVVFEELRGPIPADREVDHLCENKACYRDNHLDLVPHAENGRRSAKFTERIVQTVRDLYATGLSTRAVARQTGVSKSHVHAIVSGGRWA